MPSTSGIVEAVSIKPLPTPDRFGNEYRASVKVGEDWFSYGSLKKDKINVKVGDSWKQVEKGQEVEFMYTVSGDFKNVTKKSFSILGEPKQSTAKPQAAPKSGAPKQFVNPAQRGQAMNLAAEVLGYKQADFASEKKVIEAIQWYVTACDVFEDLWEKAVAGLQEEGQEDDAPFDTDDDMDI